MMLDLCLSQEYPQIEETGNPELDEEFEAVEPKRIGFDNWARNKIPLTSKAAVSNFPTPIPTQKIERVLASKDFDSLDPSSMSNSDPKKRVLLKDNKIAQELVPLEDHLEDEISLKERKDDLIAI